MNASRYFTPKYFARRYFAIRPAGVAVFFRASVEIDLAEVTRTALEYAEVAYAALEITEILALPPASQEAFITFVISLVTMPNINNFELTGIAIAFEDVSAVEPPASEATLELKFTEITDSDVTHEEAMAPPEEIQSATVKISED